MPTGVPRSTEEADLLNRSNKTIKIGEVNTGGQSDATLHEGA